MMRSNRQLVKSDPASFREACATPCFLQLLRLCDQCPSPYSGIIAFTLGLSAFQIILFWMMLFVFLSGTLENPLGKDQRLLILLRASEEIFCDRFDGIRVDPGTIGKS